MILPRHGAAGGPAQSLSIPSLTQHQFPLATTTLLKSFYPTDTEAKPSVSRFSTSLENLDGAGQRPGVLHPTKPPQTPTLPPQNQDLAFAWPQSRVAAAQHPVEKQDWAMSYFAEAPGESLAVPRVVPSLFISRGPVPGAPGVDLGVIYRHQKTGTAGAGRSVGMSPSPCAPRTITRHQAGPSLTTHLVPVRRQLEPTLNAPPPSSWWDA